MARLWGGGSIRVFISHVDQHKKRATQIKNALADLGIASFVAHEDIEPSEEWQTEIIRALSSMNMFIALLTEGFKESNWTDQEVGFAIARRIPILPVGKELTPYGFMGKYQALRRSGSNGRPVAMKIFEMALMDENLQEFAKDSFISAVLNAYDFRHANALSRLLVKIDRLSPNQEEKLVNAFNSNDQVHRAWYFRDHIAAQLERMTGTPYLIDDQGALFQMPQPEEIPF